VRLFLRLRDRLKGDRPASKVRTPVSPCEPRWPVPDPLTFTEAERVNTHKYIDLIKRHIPMNKEPPTGPKVRATLGYAGMC
jgi:hypothetical protein